MKLQNLLPFSVLAAMGLAVAVLPRDVSSVSERSEAGIRACPTKCRDIFSQCINDDLLGLDTCQEIKCQDSDCAQCDSQCGKASLLTISSDNDNVERRESAVDKADEQEPTSDGTFDNGIDLAATGPYCPAYCVRGHQGCLEQKNSLAECNRRFCKTMCLRMCSWCW